jgi:hypothetical protein
MEHYAGIDVSLELSSVCVVDAQGKIVKEVKVASEPEALVSFFKATGFAVKRIGLEAGPLSQWLYAGLKQAGFETVLLETRHVKAALSAIPRFSWSTRHSPTRPQPQWRGQWSSSLCCDLNGCIRIVVAMERPRKS